MTTKLHKQKPREDDWGFADWADDNGRIVTFNTIAYQMWDAWRSDCMYDKRDEQLTENEVRMSSGYVANHSAFRENEVKEPGIYDDELGAQRTEYLIVVPQKTLRREVCEFWIRKLNAKYRKDFKLVWA